MSDRGAFSTIGQRSDYQIGKAPSRSLSELAYAMDLAAKLSPPDENLGFSPKYRPGFSPIELLPGSG